MIAPIVALRINAHANVERNAYESRALVDNRVREQERVRDRK